MYGYIYKVTNLINNKIYIGQHKYSKPEIDSHYWAGGYLINEAFKKYGKSNFKRQLLETAETKEQLDVLEKKYIAELKPEYNIADGGQGGILSVEIEKKRLKIITSEAQRKKLSSLRKGRKFSAEHKQHLSEALTGRKASDEAKKHMSEAQKGRKRTQEAIKKQIETRKLNAKPSPNKGKKLTSEQKSRISETVKNFYKEHPDAWMGSHRHLFKPVVCVETQVVYSGIREAGRQLNIDATSIMKVLSGKYKTAGGYHWEHYNEGTEKED